MSPVSTIEIEGKLQIHLYTIGIESPFRYHVKNRLRFYQAGSSCTVTDLPPLIPRPAGISRHPRFPALPASPVN